MDKPFRVLQINSGSVNFGGVSSFLYNVYIHIDRNEVQFDFLSPDLTTYGIHREDIDAMGGQIYEFKIKGNVLAKKVKLFFKLKKFLEQSDYKIVHINSGNIFFNFFASAAVKKAGVPIRIIHSHNAGDTSGKLKRSMFGILKPLLEKNATDFFACSKLAAEYMFTEETAKSGKVKVIPNGIDTEKFAYNETVRAEMRRELGLEDKFVVGNIARFMPQKNHHFLIEVFEKIAKKQENAVLILVGQGELMDEIKELVHVKKLDEKVVFLGQRSDVEKLYQAMDVFVLTSFHEGLGNVLVEAQNSGCPCVASTTIPEEVNITNLVDFIRLEESVDQWAECVLSKRTISRKNMSDMVCNARYDSNQTADMLQNFYINQIRNI